MSDTVCIKNDKNEENKYYIFEFNKETVKARLVQTRRRKPPPVIEIHWKEVVKHEITRSNNFELTRRRKSELLAVSGLKNSDTVDIGTFSGYFFFLHTKKLFSQQKEQNHQNFV